MRVLLLPAGPQGGEAQREALLSAPSTQCGREWHRAVPWEGQTCLDRERGQTVGQAS